MLIRRTHDAVMFSLKKVLTLACERQSFLKTQIYLLPQGLTFIFLGLVFKKLKPESLNLFY